jgi:NADH dehydrogenase [ubiquinone] 1 alpha subcomplex assembly factor 7
MAAPSLETEIRPRIAANGPISVAEYMALCLADPQHGYYTTRDPFGARGDFTTAPDVSQMFGELIGLWMAAVWREIGAPKPVHILELGPGRGTLMADALRAMKTVPGLREAAVVHLVEISPVLRIRQEQALETAGVPVLWHASLDDVAEGPALMVANEFFDALPVHQAVKNADGWHERRVGIDADGKFQFMLAPEPLADFDSRLPPRLRHAPNGAIFEWRDSEMARALATRVANGGAALVIDYGHLQGGLGDTLQAMHAHAYADPLHAPGELDVTAHVDFERLIEDAHAAGAAAFGPIEQGEFLRHLGIEQRAAKLKANAPPTVAADIDAALARLTGSGPNQMGALFKVVGFAQPTLGALPGFELQ